MVEKTSFVSAWDGKMAEVKVLRIAGTSNNNVVENIGSRNDFVRFSLTYIFRRML